MFLTITYFPPTMQEYFDVVQSTILHGRDGLLIAGVLLVAVGLINIVRARRFRKRWLQALASGKQWF